MRSPEILYKYLPQSRLDVLVDGRIRFSPPRDLNDPFESRPLVRANRSSAMRRAQLELDGDLTSRVAEFEAFAVEHGPQAVWDAVNETLGILSLSTNPTQPVMWGHYADSYRGFLVGFDAVHPWLAGPENSDDLLEQVRPVNYTLKRPRVEVGSRDDIDLRAFALGTVLTKHKAWSFEDEWRAVRMRAGSLPPGNCEGVSHLFEIPAETVLEIVMGPRMETTNQQILHKMVADGSYPSALVRRLVLAKDTFDLTIEEEPISYRRGQDPD